jgi:hypothetical protein
MQDLIDNLSEAFKARDRKALGVFSDHVAESGDPELLSLWVSYCALLDFRADQQEMLEFIILPPTMDHTRRMVVEIDTITASADALLARLDTAWTAYLALRAQQEPAGE